MSGNTWLFVLGGLAALWFLSRALVRQRGGGGLAAMFKREARAVVPGLGPHAISTLLGDVARFARARPDIRAAALLGPFARDEGRPDMAVHLLFLCEAPERFTRDPWLGTFNYVTRGHPVVSSEKGKAVGAEVLDVTLRGAPKLHCVFLGLGTARDPDGDITAQAKTLLEDTPAVLLHDPAGALKALVTASGGKINPAPGDVIQAG